MDRSIYKRLYKLVSGYWPFLVLSSLSAFIYVAFNGLSVWLTATLFNNILTDFDELIMNQNILASSKVSINDQLKYWTNQLILRNTAIESLKVLCYTLIGSFLIKNFFGQTVFDQNLLCCSKKCFDQKMLSDQNKFCSKTALIKKK